MYYQPSYFENKSTSFHAFYRLQARVSELLYFKPRTRFQAMAGFILCKITYCEVVSSNMSQLVANPRIFRLSMKGQFDAYVKGPKLNSRLAYSSQLYSKS